MSALGRGPFQLVVESDSDDDVDEGATADGIPSEDEFGEDVAMNTVDVEVSKSL